MPAIARAAELAPGTLYLYFPSKEALYIELLVEGYEELLGRLRAAVGAAAEPRRQAEALIDAFVGHARERPEYFDIIFFVLQRDAGGQRGTLVDPDRLRRIEAQEAACKAIATEVLARLRPQLSPGELGLSVDAVWSMLVGVVFYFRRDGDGRFAAVADKARRLIVESLTGAVGREACRP